MNKNMNNNNSFTSLCFLDDVCHAQSLLLTMHNSSRAFHVMCFTLSTFALRMLHRRTEQSLMHSSLPHVVSTKIAQIRLL